MHIADTLERVVDAAAGHLDDGLRDAAAQSPSGLTKSVAPSALAISHLSGLISTAMMRAALAITAPWMQERPIPPSPNTATVEPGFHLGGIQHRADAGGDTAAQQADLVERRRLVHFGQGDLRHHGILGKGGTPHVVVDRLCRSWRSGGCDPACNRSIPSRRSTGRDWSWLSGSIRTRRTPEYRAESHGRPASDPLHPGPHSTTSQPPSCPNTQGKAPSGSSPDSVKASVWQTPEATTFSSTSPSFGPSTSITSIDRGFFGSQATAARAFIVSSPQHFP